MLMILRYIYHFAHTHLPLTILQQVQSKAALLTCGLGWCHTGLCSMTLRQNYSLLDLNNSYRKFPLTQLRLATHRLIKPSESVRNLGSWFDSHMNMNVQVGKICSKAFYGLYNIRKIRKFLSPESTKILFHAFVTCHLDYCNSLLHGISQYQINLYRKSLTQLLQLLLYLRNSTILPRFCSSSTGCPLIFVFDLKSPFLAINPSMEPHLPT